MAKSEVERRLVAILSADVTGYTRLIRADQDTTLAGWHTLCDDVIDPMIEAYRGRIVKLTGDGFLAEFVTTHDAVRCAVEIQAELGSRNAVAPEDRRIDFRMGINLGDIVADDKDIYGDGVNIAARLQELANPGGIYISANVHDQVAHRLSYNYEDLGEQTLKNIDQSIQIYSVGIEPATIEQPTTKNPFMTPRRMVTAISAAAAVIIAIAVFTVLQTQIFPDQQLAAFKSAAAYPLPDKASVAVLPFSNLSDGGKYDYFSDGVTEDIITDLSKLSNIFVIGRNSSFTYKGRTVKAQDVGRDLGVRYVLEGSVRRSSNKIRISARLVDAVSGNLMWAERHDQVLKDVFAAQDSITHKVVSAMKVNFHSDELERVDRRVVQNFVAYDMFLRGRQAMNPVSKEGLIEASKAFVTVTKLDPKFAGGYAGISLTHSLAVRLGFSGFPPADIEESFSWANRAMTIDRDYAWANLAMASAFLMKRQHNKAVAAAKRAVDLEPSNSDAHGLLGLMLVLSGDPKDAIDPIERARRLNPLFQASYLQFKMLAMFMNKNYAGAVNAAVMKNQLHGPCDSSNCVAIELAARHHAGNKGQNIADLKRRLKEKHPNFKLGSWMFPSVFKNPDHAIHIYDRLQEAGIE